MPEAKTKRRAAKAKREGKAPTTQAGEFVREEMHHVKEGKHGAKNRAQAIAIGLSKARKTGTKVPEKKGTTRARNRKKVPGAKSKKAPQRARPSTKTGSRRAPSKRTTSAKSARSKATKSRTTKRGSSKRTTGRSKRSGSSRRKS